MAKRPSRRGIPAPQALGFLIKSHYLADEYPTALTTDRFAAFCVANYSNLPATEVLLKRITQGARYSAPRRMDARRPLFLPHPASQLALSRVIADHRREIVTAINRSALTLYNTEPDMKNERFFVGIDFKGKAEREAEILARYPFIMLTDIANFFHTVYTHSLPWATLGKQAVKDALEPGADKKEKKQVEDHWSHHLDRAIQRGNSRETFGIPVGPDTSRIIAEVLLSGIHLNPELVAILSGREGYRLVDDFFIGFDDEAAAGHCRDVLRRTLWQYNLHLNEEKTDIVRSSQFFEGGWKHEIESFAISVQSAAKQRESIQRLMEISLHYCNLRHDPIPASFFCQRLTTIDIISKNFRFVRDCMLRVARDFTGCLKSVVRFVTQFRDQLGDADSRQVLERWLTQLFAAHTRRGHDMEIAHALVICGILGIPITREAIGLQEREASPVVLAVLGLLAADGLLDEPWDNWRPDPVANVLNGPFWLPYYEAAVRGWSSESEVINTAAGDDFFGPLLKAGVTFLDTADFKSAVPAAAPKSAGGKPHVVRRAPVRSSRRRSTNEYE